MSACRRFENEGLVRLEEGGTLDLHFQSCPDCVKARAAYSALQQRLTALGSDHAPEGWQQAVWSEIARRGARRPGSRTFGMLAAAAAVLIATVIAVRMVQPPDDGRLLVAEIERSGQIFRGGADAQPGDFLILRARVGTTRHAELRVYQDDRRLVAACSTDAPCVWRDGEIRGRVRLASTGAYQPVLVLSDAPLPAPAGRLDEDAGAAHRAGGRVELGEPVIVR